VLVVFLALFLVSSYLWLYEARYFVGRASGVRTSFSIDNSYLFVSPLRAKADGQEKVRITVFVLNNQGLGVPGRKVFVSRDANLIIETPQSLTDDLGKAFFDVAASKSGEYYLQVTVDDASLKQKAHLSFY